MYSRSMGGYVRRELKLLLEWERACLSSCITILISTYIRYQVRIFVAAEAIPILPKWDSK